MFNLPQEFIEVSAPTIETETISKCPVCLSDHYRTYATGYDYELCTCANLWTFVQCENCNHVWLNPRPAVHTLGTIYPPHYYAYNYKNSVHIIARKGKEWLDRFKMRGILNYVRQPQSYMDVGCGDGRFLRVMHRKHLAKEKIYGIELDTDVVNKLRQEGFQAYDQRVETIADIPANTLDLVTMFHVIEHVDDPAQVVHQIYNWLKPGGILAVETPNIESLDARLFSKTYWGGYHIPRHWNLFTPKSLSRIMSESGLEVEAIQYQTGHSFWMYSLHHWTRYHCNWQLLSNFFDPLKGLPFLILFTGWDKLRSLLKFKTSAMLMIVRKPHV